MAKRIDQLQAEIITEGVIDELAKDSQDYQSLNEFPILKKIILAASEAYVDTALEELERQGKRVSGNLMKGLEETPLLETDQGYEIEIGYQQGSAGAEYFSYVNKGVQGWQSGQPNSPHKFTKSNPHPDMVTAIELWMRSRSIMGRNEDQKTNLNATQKKNKSLSQLNGKKRLMSLAYVFARSIKRKGIPYSGYLDKATEAQFGKGFTDAVVAAVVGDIRVYIRKLDSLINKDDNNQN